MSRTHALAPARAALVALACVVLLALLAFAPGAGLAEEEAHKVGHAEDGSATYYTVAQAWTAANSGTTVVMDDDWYTTAMLTARGGANVTIKMNGHKIYRNGSTRDDGVLQVGKGASLTLDGTGAQATLSFRKFANGDEATLTTGGLVAGGDSRETAGGIDMLEGSTLNLVGVAVAGNRGYSESGGGVGMDGDNCTLNMTDTIITFNEGSAGAFSYGRGGGVFVDGEKCSINMTRSIITDNYAEMGGGIYSNDDATTITLKDGSSIYLNRASKASSTFNSGGQGGGVYFNYSNFTITGDGTASISANASDDDGGGIYICSRTVGSNKGAISGITFSKNSGEDGGAIYVDQENVTIENCTFSENGKNDCGETEQGGTIYIDNDNTTIKNCTITKSRSNDEGGAIYNNNNGTLIQDCTITDCTSGGEGGGIWTSCYNDIKLAGKVVVRDNKRTDGAADDVFLNSNSGNTVRAYLKGNVEAGSCVGIRTGIEDNRVVVENLTNYIEGTFFLNQGSDYHLSYSASDNELSQIKGGLEYLVTVNGQGETRYAQGEQVTIDAGSFGDWKAFQCWDVEGSSGLWDAASVISNPLKPTITFTMPGNDVHLTAVFGQDMVYQTSVRIDVDAPEVGQELPATGTLTYTAADGSAVTRQVDVTWSEITETWDVIPAEGVAKFSTNYGPQVVVPRDLEAGLAFWAGMGSANVDLRVGSAQQSSCSQASVDSATGALTAYGQMVTTRAKLLASIETAAVTVRAGTSAAELQAAMPATLAGTDELGADVTLTLQAASEVDWRALGVLGEDGTVAEPEGDSATFEVSLAVTACSDASLEIPESLSAVTVTLTVTHTALAVTFDAAGGSYEPAAQTVAFGACAQAPEEPTFAGHAFLGWFADGADQAWDFATPVTSSMNLTARWQAVLEVMFEPANGGDVFTQNVMSGACVQAPELPTREGYVFLGWFADGASEAWDFAAPVVADMTLTARWQLVASYRFIDVAEGTWFYDWVYQACGLGLMTGYRDGMGVSTGYFGPGDFLTRGQVATVLWRISGSPDADDSGAIYSFPDVPEGSWCSQAVYWCAERGIVTGYMAGEHKGYFMPDEPVTREELAVMVYRFEREAGVKTDEVPSANFDRCPDAGEVSEWAAEAVRWCAAAGVLTGIKEPGADGAVTYWLAPAEHTTRAQAAKVFCYAWDLRWNAGQDPYEAVEGYQAAAQAALAEGQADEAATFEDVTFAEAGAEAVTTESTAVEGAGAEAIVTEGESSGSEEAVFQGPEAAQAAPDSGTQGTADVQASGDAPAEDAPDASSVFESPVDADGPVVGESASWNLPQAA